MYVCAQTQMGMHMLNPFQVEILFQTEKSVVKFTSEGTLSIYHQYSILHKMMTYISNTFGEKFIYSA